MKHKYTILRSVRYLVRLTSRGDTRLTLTDAPDLRLVHHLGLLHLPDHRGVQLVHLVQVHGAAGLETKHDKHRTCIYTVTNDA